MQKLMLAEDIFDQLENGKLVTIRKGRRDIKLGHLKFESLETKRTNIVHVDMVYYSELINVIEEDLKNDGFSNHIELFKTMRRFYPDIDFNDEVTVIRFS